MRIIIFVLIATFLVFPAKADDCRGLNTYQHGRCATKNADAALKQVLSAYDQLIHINIPDMVSFAGLKKELVQSQKKWLDYVNTECEFEADSMVGSASAFVGSECEEDMYKERSTYLNRLLEDWISLAAPDHG